MNDNEREDRFIWGEGDIEITSSPAASGNTSEAEDLFLRAFDWLRDHYAEFVFYVERDIVWTIQSKLKELIQQENLPFRVYNDYPMLSGPKLSADIVIFEGDDVRLAVEFKYEPSHLRTDIPANKFPVCFWDMKGIAKDIERIRKFVTEGTAEKAISIFIDEGGFFRYRPAHPGSEWLDWEVKGPEWLRPSILHAWASSR